MRMKVGSCGIQIIPENEQDVAYIEDTLGLKEETSFIKLERINASGLSCIAYLEAKKA